MNTPQRQGDVWAAREVAVAAAGIPVKRQYEVLTDIDQLFRAYAVMSVAKGDLKQLRRAIKDAKSLRDNIAAMPHGVRLSLGTLVGDDGAHELTEPLKWLPLTTFIDQAQRVLDGESKGPGGQTNKIRWLLFQLVSLWKHEMSDAVGVRRNGEDNTYPNSPLLELVEQLLRIEKIPFHSHQSLGVELHKLYGVV